MTTTTKAPRTRHRAVLPTKIEHAFKNSSTRRDDNKTSRLDYAAGYEDGYRAALAEVAHHAKKLERELKL